MATVTSEKPPLEKRTLAASLALAVAPLKNRNFSLLMGGRVTSNMGRNMRVFARAWLVLELTNSPFLLGLVTSSLAWPMLFMPFVGGVLADRIDRRKLLLYTEFALVILWVAQSLVITLGVVEWWHLMVTSVLSGIIQSVGRPGHHAMVGNVVSKQQLSSAVAIDSVADHWPRAVGLLAATMLVVSIGVEGLFWITATLQFLTGISLLFMKWERQAPAEAAKKSVRGNLLDAFNYVKGESIIVGLVIMAIAASMFGGIGFLMPVFARDILGVGAQGLGTLMLSSTLGVSIGSLMIMGLANHARRGLLLVAGSLFTTAFAIGFSRSEVFWLSIALVFGMGIFQTVRQTLMDMVMQLLATNEMRGRVMALRVSIQGYSWIGVLLLGALAEGIGAANAVLIGASVSGLVAVVIFILMPRIPRFR